MTSCQGQGFIPCTMLHAFPLTSPRHSFITSIILLDCLTSKPLFLEHSFTVLIHLFLHYPLGDYQHTLLHRLFWQSYPSPFSPHGRTTREHLPQSFRLLPSSLRTAPLFVHPPNTKQTSEVIHLYNTNSRSLLAMFHARLAQSNFKSRASTPRKETRRKHI